jgi:hypothetical protein
VADPPLERRRPAVGTGTGVPGRTGVSAAEAPFQTLAREAPVGIFRTDAAGDYVYTNERWCRIAGIEPAAAAGRGWFAAIHPDDRHRVTELWRQAVEAASAFDMEYRLRRPDGTSSWVLGQAVRLGSGQGAVGYVGTITDITVHKRLQELLAGENRILELVAADAPLPQVMERLARLIESQADGIIASILFLDDAGECIRHGAAPSLPPSFVKAIEGLRIGPKTGSCGTAMYRRETVIVEDILEDPLWDDYRELGVAHGLRACWSTPILARDGRVLGSFAMYYREVRRPTAHETELVAAATQIARVAIERHSTDAALRKSEEQLRHSQRMEAIGRLAGGVAHDFNNILTAILGYSDLVLGAIDPGEENHSFVTEIRDAANRAASLTHQLLAFGRRQVLRPMVLPVNELVEGVAGMLRRLIAENVELTVELDPAAGYALVDRGQIEQVVLNLAVDARDSMPGGGRLVLRTARRATGDEDWSVIAVSDSGKAIDPENQEHLFEPFYSTRVLGRGTGLGLATAYGIVDQSGGTIAVHSEPDRGTTFEVLLPAASAPEVEDVAPVTAARRGTGERVLLVEDEPAVRAALRALLQARGFHVEEAKDAESALALMATLSAGIAIIITDMVLPGMSGAELAVALRAAHPGTPILFISGYSEDAVHGGAGLEVGTAFLSKPFTAEVLERTIRRLLDG